MVKAPQLPTAKEVEEVEVREPEEGLPSRQAIGDDMPHVETPDLGVDRVETGDTLNLDASFYMNVHSDKTLFWVNQLNGEVQRWIDRGAAPVPVVNRTGKVYEGITDQVESQWVRVVTEDAKGGSFWIYLLMCDPEIYDSVKLAPVRKRQKAIQDALGKGMDQSDSKSGLKSYAPNLPTGGVGMERTHGELEQ